MMIYLWKNIKYEKNAKICIKYAKNMQNVVYSFPNNFKFCAIKKKLLSFLTKITTIIIVKRFQENSFKCYIMQKLTFLQVLMLICIKRVYYLSLLVFFR